MARLALLAVGGALGLAQALVQLGDGRGLARLVAKLVVIARRLDRVGQILGRHGSRGNGWRAHCRTDGWRRGHDYVPPKQIQRSLRQLQPAAGRHAAQALRGAGDAGVQARALQQRGLGDKQRTRTKHFLEGLVNRQVVRERKAKAIEPAGEVLQRITRVEHRHAICRQTHGQCAQQGLALARRLVALAADQHQSAAQRQAAREQPGQGIAHAGADDEHFKARDCTRSLSHSDGPVAGLPALALGQRLAQRIARQGGHGQRPAPLRPALCRKRSANEDAGGRGARLRQDVGHGHDPRHPAHRRAQFDARRLSPSVPPGQPVDKPAPKPRQYIGRRRGPGRGTALAGMLDGQARHGATRRLLRQLPRHDARMGIDGVADQPGQCVRMPSLASIVGLSQGIGGQRAEDAQRRQGRRERLVAEIQAPCVQAIPVHVAASALWLRYRRAPQVTAATRARASRWAVAAPGPHWRAAICRTARSPS